MREDPDARYVGQKHFIKAIADTKPRISAEMLAFYEQFRRSSHIESI